MMLDYLDKTKGCLIGGAIGDALGYPVEFLSEEAIKQRYGFVKEFIGDPKISDDTQMTLYTAVSLLFAVTRGMARGVGGDPRDIIYLAKSYLRWYEGQKGIKDGAYPSFLRYVSHLNDNRAPGNTCLSALAQYKDTGIFATIDAPFNMSKGCGGVMRVAPIGLYFGRLNADGLAIDAFDAAKTGAEAAALTHGHPLGYIPAAFLSCLVYHIVNPNCSGDLEVFAKNSLIITKELYGTKKHWDEFEAIIEKAMSLSKDRSILEIDAIHQLGEGWVGEEAIAISLYCCLRHSDSFADAVQFAVNHKGDSDSTGAIAGNIIGAYLGFEGVMRSFPDYWKIEYFDLISEIASDLIGEIPNDLYSNSDSWWSHKYECAGSQEEIANHWQRYRATAPGIEKGRSDCPLKGNNNMNIKLILGDITKLDSSIECIVNAANETLLGGGGVDGAIHAAAGPELYNECLALHGCESGDAKYTKAYRLPQKYIIHTVGPKYYSDPNPALTLEKCYRKSLELADELGCESIAFPSISTGAYRYPVKEAAEICAKTISSYRPKNKLARVYMCVLKKDETYFAYERSFSLLYND